MCTVQSAPKEREQHVSFQIQVTRNALRISNAETTKKKNKLIIVCSSKVRLIDFVWTSFAKPELLLKKHAPPSLLTLTVCVNGIVGRGYFIFEYQKHKSNCYLISASFSLYLSLCTKFQFPLKINGKLLFFKRST